MKVILALLVLVAVISAIPIDEDEYQLHQLQKRYMSSKFPVASSNKNGVSTGHWQVMMHLDNNMKDILRAMVDKKRDRDYPLY